MVGDVDEGEQAGAAGAHDEAAKGGEVVGAGVSGGNRGGRGLELRKLVGRDADGRTIRKDMRMQVDHARHHQLAAGIEHLQRAVGRDAGCNFLDLAVADADVAHLRQRLARIQHLSALDQEVELVLRSHGAGNLRRQGREDGHAARGHGAKDTPASGAGDHAMVRGPEGRGPEGWRLSVMEVS